MAVLFCGTYRQDFEAFLTAATPASITEDVSGAIPNANQSIRIQGAASLQKFFDFAAPQSTFGVSFGFRGLTTAVSDKIVFMARDNANARDLFRLRTTSTGTAATCVFEIWNGSVWNSAGSLAMTLDSGSVSIYEVFVIMNTTTGQVTIRKNGSTQLNATGLNTQPTASTAVDQILFGPSHNTTGSTSAFSGIIVADEDTIGMEFFTRNLTTGTSLVAEWTGHVVTNVNGGEDTGITSTTADQKSTFLKAQLGSAYDSHDVLAVGVSVRGRRTGVGPAGVRPMLRRGTAESFGATTSLGTASADTQTYEIFTVDPDGGGALTRANFDACQVGVQSRAV